MPLRRLYITVLLLAIAASPLAAQSFFHKKHVAVHHRADLLHARAVFLYQGQIVGPVENARAVLYDTSMTPASETVAAMSSSGHSVIEANRACHAFVPGKQLTVDPGGELYFDYVERGNYTIFVCAQVRFRGIAAPVWVSGEVPVSSKSFTSDRAVSYELPQPIQITLDPYAAELKAEPLDMPELLASR